MSRMKLWLHTVTLSFLKCLNLSACDRLCDFLQFDWIARQHHLYRLFLFMEIFLQRVFWLDTWVSREGCFIRKQRTSFSPHPVWSLNIYHLDSAGESFYEGKDNGTERICIFLSDSSAHVYRHKNCEVYLWRRENCSTKTQTSVV